MLYYVLFRPSTVKQLSKYISTSQKNVMVITETLLVNLLLFSNYVIGQVLLTNYPNILTYIGKV